MASQGSFDLSNTVCSDTLSEPSIPDVNDLRLGDVDVVSDNSALNLLSNGRSRRSKAS